MSSSSRRAPPRQVPPPEQSLGAAGHARFIPREELTDFTNWSPGALGPAARPASTQGLHARLDAATPDHVAPPSGPASAAERSTDMAFGPSAAEVEALQRTARQAGYQDGYRDGLAALENFKRSFAQQMASQIGALVQTMERELQELESDMAASLTRAATGLARQIVRSELATQPELVAQVARQAVATLSQAVRRIELRVHPDDLALVQAGLGEDMQSRGIVCVADASVARGGCKAGSELGSVDARIDLHWEQALRRLGQRPEDWPLHDGDVF